MTRSDDAVELAVGGRPLRLRWARNRLHYQPSTFRLTLEGFEGLPAEGTEVAGEALETLLAEAQAALAPHRPSVLRVTVESGSALLPHLHALGFLFVRGVYVLALQVADLVRAPAAAADQALRLVLPAEARALASEGEIMAAWEEAYGRGARLDPATPDALSEEERRSLFLGYEDLDTELSVCAFEDDKLVGICPVHVGNAERERELGAVGVAAGWEERNTEMSHAMIRAVAERAEARGVERLLAEVDADAPYSVHTYAALPGRVVESLVSLMYVPRWGVAELAG